MPPSRRSSALAVVAALATIAGCHDKRKPIARVDAGPPVVLVDRKHDPVGPTTPEVEPDDTPAQAMSLQPGARIAADLSSATDVDCFRLRLPDGVDLGAPNDDGGQGVILATVTAGPAERALTLSLEGDHGHTIATRRGPTASLSALRLEREVVACVRLPTSKAAPTTPVAYVLAYDLRDARLDEQPQPEVELDDTPATAIHLGPGGTIAGVLDGDDDRDFIALPAVDAGATFRVEVSEEAGAQPGAQIDLKLRNATATIVSARGRGSELRLRNLPGGGGPLFLQLRTIDGRGPMAYTLRVASEPALGAGVEIEPNDDRAHANHVAPDDALAGYLWPGDVDWFCGDVALGARVDALADVDWRLELTDESGKTVAKADAGKRGEGEALPADPRARCVRLSARQRDTAFDEPYRLSFTN